jgi:hypothetical protein
MSAQQFGETIIKATTPRISCISVRNRLIVAITFFDAVILGPRRDIEPELIDYELEEYNSVLTLDVPMTRPVFTPVED